MFVRFFNRHFMGLDPWFGGDFLWTWCVKVEDLRLEEEETMDFDVYFVMVYIKLLLFWFFNLFGATSFI